MKKELASLALLGVLGLSSCTTDTLRMENFEAKYRPNCFYDCVEKRDDGIEIKYQIYQSGNLGSVKYNGKRFGYTDTIIFPAAKERWEYLKDQFLLQRVTSERKVAEDILNRKE